MAELRIHCQGGKGWCNGVDRALPAVIDHAAGACLQSCLVLPYLSLPVALSVWDLLFVAPPVPTSCQDMSDCRGASTGSRLV